MDSLDPQTQEHVAELEQQREAIEAPCEPGQYRILRRMVSNPQNHFAVGFGGGSVHGLAGNCALAAILNELELRPHVQEVWGTSAGAVIGGAYAGGTAVEELLEIIEGLQHGGIDVPKWEIFVKGFFRGLFQKKLPEGLVLGRRFSQAIRRGQRVENIEQCEIPLRIITSTDDGHARKVIHRQGPLNEAICASMCLPGMFFPVQDWNGEPYGYFDGGVVEKTPLVSIIEDYFREARSAQLVVLCTHFDSSARVTKPVGFLPRFVSVISQLEDALWARQLDQAKETPNCKFMVLNPRIPLGGMLDFALVRLMYLWARRVFKEQLSNAHLAARFDAR